MLQALTEGRVLTPKEKQIHTSGLVSVLKDLHDELDRALLQAYGWPDLVPGEHSKDELLTRLLALNAQRALEEAVGTIRWLRPAFQNPQKSQSNNELLTQVNHALDLDLIDENQSQIDSTKKRATPAVKTVASAAQAWPATLPEQVRAVAQVLSSSAVPLTLAALEARFKGRGPWKKGLPMLLQTLEAVGRAQPVALEGAVGWRA